VINTIVTKDILSYSDDMILNESELCTH